MASITDIAKRANVAKSTVSLVINNSGYVSEKTRKKVEDVMKELNYVPNQLAKNLSRRKSNIVGIVMPDIMHPFFSTFIKYAEQELYEKGYMTMVCGTIGREKVEEEYLNRLNRKAMDGIIMGVHSLNIEMYEKSKYPIVTLDRFLGNNIPMVTSNHKQAAELTANLLIKNNCKHVVQFIGSGKVSVGSDSYWKYCKELLEAAGIKIDFLVIGFNAFTMEKYQQSAEQLFDTYKEVDGIIGVDMAILSCFKIAVERGYNIPNDLKLIAYDGTFVTRMTDPIITAIVQPVKNLALEAVNTIINLIEGNEIKEKRIMLDVELQKGMTTL